MDAGRGDKRGEEKKMKDTVQCGCLLVVHSQEYIRSGFITSRVNDNKGRENIEGG